ncbi:MAG: efflux RND transporter periplasmic adaptor subunit [Candidatus Omnitrophica bacterium]|nr:efflux RND transporter periplasmic adaptor subunit [Candidatus Omnitrophota bacterium]
MKGGHRWVWGLVVLIILFGLGGLFYPRDTGQQMGAAHPGMPAVPVEIEAASKGNIGIYVNALGSVTPVNTVVVNSRVGGQLMQVNFREGEMVREGDSLVEIDPRPLQAQLTQAEGQYERDKALLENALIDLKRYETAYSQRAIPEQQLASQRATVHQYQGDVKFDQGQVDNAKLQLSYCHIASPISGLVGLRLVDPGNIIQANSTSPLLVVVQVQPITVIFSVAEDYLPEIQRQMRQGHPMAVEVYNRTQQAKLAAGSVLALDNQIDPATGTVRIRALFANEDNALFPNQFVNARLQLENLIGVTLVPAAAVQRNTQGAFVYVVQANQTVAARPVEVRATENNVSAVEGLQPGEVIATDNFNRLQDGVKVVPRQLPAGTNQAGKR